MVNTKQEIENIITMVNCRRSEFLETIKNCTEKITLSSGSWHSNYTIFSGRNIIAIYDYTGKKLQ